MKKTSKKAMYLVLTCLLLVITPKNSYAATEILLPQLGNLHLRHENIVFKDNIFYVTTETISYIIEPTEGKWDNIEKSFTYMWHKNKITLYLGKPYIMYNNEKVKIANTPLLEQGHLYVPISIIKDVFGGRVSYDKKKDALTIDLKVEDFEDEMSNPFFEIDKIDNITSINYWDNRDNKLKITNQDEVQSIINEYLNNEFTRIIFGGKPTLGFNYRINLYCGDEDLIRVWVCSSNLISINDCYYRLKTPLTHQFNLK